MTFEYSSLQDLLQSNADAMIFYDSLPDAARDQISKRAQHVNSFYDLKAMAQNLVGEEG